jgi:hypothetical protein
VGQLAATGRDRRHTDSPWRNLSIILFIMKKSLARYNLVRSLMLLVAICLINQGMAIASAESALPERSKDETSTPGPGEDDDYGQGVTTEFRR